MKPFHTLQTVDSWHISYLAPFVLVPIAVRLNQISN